MPSTVEEIAHEPRHLIGLLEMWQVAGVVDKLDMGARDPLRELVGIGRRDHLIPIPPDDQGRHRDPVDAPFETLVRDRPDKFPGAGLRPDEAGLGVDTGRRIGGEREKPLRRSPGRVGKEDAAALIIG